MTRTLPADFVAEAVTWREDGHPHSARFGDVYHSRTGGAAQSLQVFLGGCGLPAAWAGRDTFTVLETGFGLGLNFLVTWAAWEADPQRCAVLHFVSVEAYPVAAADIARNVQWQEEPPGPERPPGLDTASAPCVALLPLCHQLVGAWQGLTPGVHTLRFADGRVVLTLAIGQVRDMLDGLRCQADALYLDGFSPDINPEMWSAATLRAATRLCRLGARLATYSTARPVREALGLLGWQVARHRGLPPKRRRLEGLLVPRAS